MEIRLYLLTYIQCCIFLLYKNEILVDSCTDFESYVVKKVGLSDGHVWAGHAQQVSDCIRMCIRRKPCSSINYEFSTKHCELNNGTIDDTPTKTGDNLVYSSFDWWPATVDTACYDRPCEDDEVCVPGRLEGECSYFCMSAGRKVCPMPPGGVTNGRSVNDVNVATCPDGFTGFDSATCLDTGEWSKELNAECQEIHDDYQCTDDTICSQIEAVCTNGKCLCVPGKVYNSNTYMCVPYLRFTPPNPLPTDFLNISGMRVGYLEVFHDGVYNNVCYEYWNWKATQVACRALFGTEYSGSYHKEWYNVPSQQVGDSKRFKNIDCTGSEQSIDVCPMDQVEGCDHNKDMVLSCFMQNLVEDYLLLTPGPSDGQVFIQNLSPDQRPFCSDGWGNTETDAVCRSLNADWSGDSDGEFQMSNVEAIARSLHCEGGETHIFYCRNKGWGHSGNCQNDKYIRVGCDT